MPKFSARSKRRLATADPRLQQVFNQVVKWYDCTILCGHRGKQDQNEAFNKGRSKKKWPQSKHNQEPSIAVDVAPYPIDWSNHDRFYLFAGFVLGVATQLGVPLRLGADWDGDGDPTDQRFLDLVHFELV